MIKDIGATWVILGHSERRSIFGENDQARPLVVSYTTHLLHRSSLYCNLSTLTAKFCVYYQYRTVLILVHAEDTGKLNLYVTLVVVDWGEGWSRTVSWPQYHAMHW